MQLPNHHYRVPFYSGLRTQIILERRIRIRIRMKSWVRIRIQVKKKIQIITRLKVEPWRAGDAQNGGVEAQKSQGGFVDYWSQI
jgi:hypothetical protein